MYNSNKKHIQVSDPELLNPWLKELSDNGRQQVENELARQQRALKSVLAGKMPQRTARRIIQRSQRRVNYIIADELVKGRAKA